VQGVRNANGPDQLSAREDETDASMTAKVSFEKSFEDYGTAFIQFKSAPGSGVDRALQLYGNVNNNACDKSEVYMSEAWYEHYFKPFNITLTFGKLDATNYIDTNEYANLDTSQFLALIFGNSPVIEFPSSNGAGARWPLPRQECWMPNSWQWTVRLTGIMSSMLYFLPASLIINRNFAAGKGITVLSHGAMGQTIRNGMITQGKKRTPAVTVLVLTRNLLISLEFLPDTVGRIQTCI